MFDKYFLYFYRRLISILFGIYSNPRKLTAFCVLLLVAFVLSVREFRKEREEGPVFGRTFANAMWLSFGLGLPIAMAVGGAGYLAGVLRMKRVGGSLLALSRFIVFPYKYHLVRRRHVPPDSTTTFWAIAVGMWGAAFEIVLGVFYFLTLIGIPVGLRHIKLAAPFWTPHCFRVLTDAQLDELLASGLWTSAC